MRRLALVPLLFALAFAAPAAAHPRYHDPARPDRGACSDCHPGFLGRGDLHDMHAGTIGIDCDDCHTGSGRDNPFVMWSITGYGCTGCHGRDYGETIEADYGFGLAGLFKASGYGLRKQHLLKGETGCLDCHADVPQCEILPEIVAGPVALWYGIDPCDSRSEDSTPEPNGDDSVGLDNDGDGLIDDADSDCNGCEDLDGDGYGSPAGAGCPNPQVDCDDCDPDSHPGLREATAEGNCDDGKDNDCDGRADALDPDCGAAPDRDADGVPDDTDNCPDTPNPGQEDADGDGFGDACDGCPNDADKLGPGDCGCGVPDTDSDGDGTADCIDGCPADPDKTDPGACGCGVPDTDEDGDGVPGCDDCDDLDGGNFPGNSEDCADGDDDDCDDAVDCADADCAADPGCAGADADGDGVDDDADNCTGFWNPGQGDGDLDGLGDSCDPDDEVMPLTLSRSGAADLSFAWPRTPADPGRVEYPRYRVYRGDLDRLRAAGPSAPAWNHSPLPGGCVDPAGGRTATEAGAIDGANAYYLIVGWAPSDAGPPGWIDMPPVGGDRPGSSDGSRPADAASGPCP